jgi:hypothetical protein
MSTIADTPSSEEPTPRGTGDSAEVEERRDERSEGEAAKASAPDKEADVIETLKKRTHPFD